MATTDEVAKAKKALTEAVDAHGMIVHGVAKIQKALDVPYNRAANIMMHLVAHKFVTEPDNHGLRRLVRQPGYGA